MLAINVSIPNLTIALGVMLYMYTCQISSLFDRPRTINNLHQGCKNLCWIFF